MNQDWTLQGRNQKSPETAKLQGHPALSMSKCLEIRRDTAEPDSWVESTSTPPLHLPVWLSTSELTISSDRIYCEQPFVLSEFASTMACVRNTHHHFTTPSFEIEGYCNPKLWDEVADTIRKMSQQKENTQKPNSDLSPCGIKHSKFKSTHVEWSKTWRDWSFALKLQSLSSSWLCCAPQGLIENPVFGGQSLHQSNDSFILLPSCRASRCLYRFQVTLDLFSLSSSVHIQQPTGWAQLSAENLQRPDQSNCLRSFTKIDTAKWVAPTKSSHCA